MPQFLWVEHGSDAHGLGWVIGVIEAERRRFQPHEHFAAHLEVAEKLVHVREGNARSRTEERSGNVNDASPAKTSTMA